MKEPNHPYILVEHLGYSIQKHKILHEISCSFHSTKIHGLVGPNGSGKSTFLRNICRIWYPQEGLIKINGIDYRSISRRELSKLVTLVPQNMQISFSIRVSDFIAMGRHPHLKGLQSLKKKDKDIIHQSLEKTKSAGLINRYINEISGGETQLVSISRALATEAPVILLDEPTSALDINHKLEIMDLLTTIKNEGKTIIMSVHDLELARRYCDTITILQNGAIYFTGSPLRAFIQENIKEVFDVYVEETHTDNGVSLLFYR